VILVRVRIEDYDYDWFDGPCEMPSLPPINGHIEVMDRNANMRNLRVTDVIVKAVPIKAHAETPGGLRPWNDVWTTIIVSEL
jgi:hypothetical protein